MARGGGLMMDLTGTHYSLMPGEDDGDDDLTGWL